MFKPTKLLLLIIILSIIFTNMYSQNKDNTIIGSNRPLFPDWIIKTNVLYIATTTFNLGGEMRLSDYLTLDVSVNYNPWTFSDNRKFKHFLVQPELRYWIYEPFNGHFLGANLLYVHYNAGNLPLGSLKDSRYQGNAYSLGFSYGYQWILSRHWSLEATLGLGYMYLNYSKYECQTCGSKTGESHKNYFGPTKAGVSLIYVIK